MMLFSVKGIKFSYLIHIHIHMACCVRFSLLLSFRVNEVKDVVLKIWGKTEREKRSKKKRKKKLRAFLYVGKAPKGTSSLHGVLVSGEATNQFSDACVKDSPPLSPLCSLQMGTRGRGKYGKMCHHLS